jgi:hypothetical protein
MTEAVPKTANGANGARKLAPGKQRSARRKFSVSLSEQSAQVLEELRQTTDADTDSEVFRNALRIHLVLIRAVKDGQKICLRDGKSDTLIPVDLFVREPNN